MACRLSQTQQRTCRPGPSVLSSARVHSSCSCLPKPARRVQLELASVPGSAGATKIRPAIISGALHSDRLICRPASFVRVAHWRMASSRRHSYLSGTIANACRVQLSHLQHPVKLEISGGCCSDHGCSMNDIGPWQSPRLDDPACKHQKEYKSGGLDRNPPKKNDEALKPWCKQSDPPLVHLHGNKRTL